MAHKPQTATAEIQSFCDLVKPQVEQKTKKKFEVFHAKSFITQAVVGTNYFIKVHVGGDDYLHLKVFKPLMHGEHRLDLQGVQTSKKLDDPISFFSAVSTWNTH
ncbi:hypothetical protein MHYP_G00284800 [Metynnis hypsauchen]